MTLAHRSRTKPLVRITCSVALLAGSLACERGSSSNEAPKQTPPSAATTPVAATPPPPPAPPPPKPDDIPPPPDVKAPPAEAKKTDSGLASKVLQPGKGKEKPELTDSVS